MKRKENDKKWKFCTVIVVKPSQSTVIPKKTAC